MSHREAQDLVGRTAEEIRGTGVAARGVVREALENQVAKEVLAVAEHGRARLVVGARGRSRLATIVRGSTAYKIVRLVTAPS